MKIEKELLALWEHEISYKVTRYYPTFFGEDEPETYELNSLNDIYNLDFVRQWVDEKFEKWDFSTHGNQKLIAVMKDGRQYIVANIEKKSIWRIK